MKKITTIIALLWPLIAGAQSVDFNAEPAFKNKDVAFRQIDEHTWIGNGHLVANESLYIVEGEKRALLIDAGTRIKDLDKIVAQFTDKPITLVATHLHGDHTGQPIEYFDKIWIYPVDPKTQARELSGFKGKVNYLFDGQVFDLGGRKITVFHTPGHTEGSVTFIDFDAKYGFSGDSFGSSHLLLGTTFSGFRASCLKMLDIMKRGGINILFPGHYSGDNAETPESIAHQVETCDNILSGRAKGIDKGDHGLSSKSLTITEHGRNIVYSESMVK